MATLTYLNKQYKKKVGSLPAVVLPLEDYEKMKEDLEMFRSKKFPQDIKKAREGVEKGEIISFFEAKKKLKLAYKIC